MILKQQINNKLVACGSSENQSIPGKSNTDNVIYLAHIKRSKVDVSDRRKISEVVTPNHGNMAEQLKQALELDRFVLHYQPQYSMDDQQIVGVEALLRMESETGELIRLDLFIPVAEEHGLIIPIGNWVIREACQQLRRWQDSGYQTIRMAINISPKQLSDEAIIDVITQSVTEAGIQLSDLELEITEQSIIENMTVAAKVLNELSNKGVRIAIDDFGTGYSALSYLTELPLDVIKIDRSFVANAPSDIKASRVIKGIVNLAKSLELEVVVEGIETDIQQQFVASIGCDTGQGFGFARPAEADEVESTWLTKN